MGVSSSIVPLGAWRGDRRVGELGPVRDSSALCTTLGSEVHFALDVLADTVDAKEDTATARVRHQVPSQLGL